MISTPCHCPTCDPDWPRPAAVGYARIGGIVRTSWLTDGRWQCCVCADYFWPCQLHVDGEGNTWDLCAPCGVTNPPE